MTFKEFCENFNRMINECSDDDNPFVDAANSDYAEDWATWSLDHPTQAEDFVATWVKDHPKPVYPTFGEYLSDMVARDPSLDKIPLQQLLDMPMTKKVAEYYNVTPLNLCGVTKYAHMDW